MNKLTSSNSSKYDIMADIEIPEHFISSWQQTVDVMAEIIQVPAGLIMRVHSDEIEVFLKSQNDGNIYKKGEVAPLDSGLYCETVMDTKKELLVPNALKDKHWDHNPDIEIGMISYCGLPLLWPNGKIFGTLCILDLKENHYSDLYRILMSQFKELVESGLRSIFDNIQLKNRINDGIAEIEQQHKYLQSIINGVDDPIMVIKEDYTVELMNESLKKSLKNLNLADPEHPKCYEISHHRSTPCDGLEHPCPLRDVLDTQQHTTVVHNHDTKDGKDRYIELSASPLFDKDKNCIGIIESARDITGHLNVQDELRVQKNILYHQAHHDSLTGLPNRVLFNDRLEQAIETGKRNETNIALLFIDLDHFKEINDSLGHNFGDEILKIISKRLVEVTRDKDTIARLGGDEFTVILEKLSQVQDASLIANKIIDAVSKAIIVDDNTFYVSCSIGISIYPNDGVSSQNLLKFADSAMYKAKSEGRNNYQYYNSVMTELAFERVVMEASLRAALSNEEFVVFYQPQVNAKTDKIIGMEALVRWQHPTMGLVSPAKFIPLAERTGLIVEIDRYVMKTAMTQFTQWHNLGLDTGVLAMNLAVKQLQEKDFIQILKNLLVETGCKPHCIELEVTEGQIMTKPEDAIKILQQISDLGIELAVDDFGTGYSSLAYLKKLPIDKLKIDQAFIKDLPDDEEDIGITKAVIALAQSLNLEVLAEGVETKGQKDFLLEHGCENIQGYYYSKPIPADELEVILRDGLNN